MNQTDPIFGTDISPEAREKLLESHSVHKERTTFTQELTTEEYFALQNEFTRGHIDLARMEAEAKEIADQWKAKIKEKEGSLDKALEQINAGKRQVVGILYSIPNFAKNIMNRYNKAGEVIESRPLKDEERQSRAFIAGPDGSTVPNPDERTITDIDHEEVKGTAEEQIEGMYAGPKIAGSAPGSGEVLEPEYESQDKDGILDDVSRSGNGLGPAAEEYGTGDPNTKGGAPGSGEENGMAWDDPRQVRQVPFPVINEQGQDVPAPAKGKPGRKKKVPQTPENPSGQEPLQ